MVVEVCLFQCDPVSRQENVGALRHIVEQYPADIYVLPELFAVGFEAAREHWSDHAESIPDGPTCNMISAYLNSRPKSCVVCGIPECEKKENYNTAAVIGSTWAEKYRQKCPARVNNGRILPVTPGDFRSVWIGPGELAFRWKIGLMVCHDYWGAPEFFRHYSEEKVDVIVLIADSVNRSWLATFPPLCSQYSLPVIVCNAAGVDKGASCILDSDGRHVGLRKDPVTLDYLLESPAVACASI